MHVLKMALVGVNWGIHVQIVRGSGDGTLHVAMKLDSKYCV